jgi:F-type H+-transporting ATPase subunit c
LFNDSTGAHRFARHRRLRLAAIGPGIGVGLIFASVIQGTARQPEARGAMMGTAWIGFAVTEALAIIGIALAFVFGGL